MKDKRDEAFTMVKQNTYEIVILAGLQGMKRKTHERLQGQRKITLL